MFSVIAACDGECFIKEMKTNRITTARSEISWIEKGHLKKVVTVEIQKIKNKVMWKYSLCKNIFVNIS